MVAFVQTDKERARWRKRLRATAAHVLPGGFGCSDASCIYGDAGGQHTNGGCNCMKNASSQAEMARTVRRLNTIALDLVEQVLNLEKQAIKRDVGSWHQDTLCANCEVIDGVVHCKQRGDAG